jgi:hypothetical protein
MKYLFLIFILAISFQSCENPALDKINIDVFDCSEETNFQLLYLYEDYSQSNIEKFNKDFYDTLNIELSKIQNNKITLEKEYSGYGKKKILLFNDSIQVAAETYIKIKTRKSYQILLNDLCRNEITGKTSPKILIQ